MNIHWKQIVSLLMAAVCAVSLSVTAAMPAYAVSQADINALKSESQKLEGKKKELQSKLNGLADDKAQILQKRKLLDEQSAVMASEIGVIQKQINNYASLITQSEAELAEAQEQEEAQYELFCKRVRVMEKEGKVNYWSVLFHATSFTDLLSRLDAVNEVMSADQRIIDDLKTLQAEIEEKKTALETQKTESESAKASLVTKKNQLDQQRSEATALVKEINANQEEYKQTLGELDQEEERIQARIVALSKKLAEEEAAKAAASGKKPTSNAALGGYIWPVNSRRITSPYGKRPSPGGIGSRFHKGMDIGGVGYTSEVHAAKAGTVIVSQYSSSYGNYVVVSHGSGNTTLYAHMSSRKVSVGQKVKQGDVLGITGSTGHSTGPHLHFEITENGQRIDPAKYLK